MDISIHFSDPEGEQPTPPRRDVPMVIFTRPQDWAQPARDILWPRLAERHRRERQRGQ